MSRYLQYDRDSGDYRFVDTTDWTDDQWASWGGWDGDGMVSCRSLELCENGIHYEWGLAGPNGASFVVYRFPGQSERDLNEGVAEIRRKRDVVSLTRIRLRKAV